MLKQIKNGGAVVIDKSHKSLYRTPISCMEYFNAFSLMGFALVFFTNYDFLMGLPTYKNFNYMSPAIMWLISLDYNFKNTSSKKMMCFLFSK